MRLSSVVLGGALVALGCGACAKRVGADATLTPASLAAYYPLAVGNQWTYLVNGRADKPVQVEVLKQEDGYFHDSQGGQLKVDTFGIRDQKRYLLRGPIEVGTSWNNVVSVSSTERYQIVQAGVPCESPAGAFQNCVQVEARNRVDQNVTVVNTMTFAPGVGIVRLELAAERGGQRVPQTWLELKSYRVQPPKS